MKRFNKAEGLAKVSQFDEAKHNRNPKGSDGGGRFAPKGGYSQAGREMAGMAASTVAWMGTAAALARLAPRGRVASIFANWIAPAAASMATQYGADRLMSTKQIDRPLSEDLHRAGGSIAGFALGGRFKGIRGVGVSSLGSAAGEQLGSVSHHLLERYGPDTLRRVKERFAIA